MSALDQIKQTAWGVQTLAEWFGAGGSPETQEVAEARAKVCENCPKNLPGNWWDKHLVDPVAKVIVRHLEARDKIGLKLPNDSKLGMCRACGCCVRLKVFTPIGHILHHTDEQTMLKYPNECWIKKEIHP